MIMHYVMSSDAPNNNDQQIQVILSSRKNAPVKTIHNKPNQQTNNRSTTKQQSTDLFQQHETPITQKNNLQADIMNKSYLTNKTIDSQYQTTDYSTTASSSAFISSLTTNKFYNAGYKGIAVIVFLTSMVSIGSFGLYQWYQWCQGL